LSTLPTLRTRLLRGIAVGLAYYLLGRFGLSLPYKLSVVTLLWLPIGVAVPAAYRWGWSMLWAVAAAEMASTLATIPGRWAVPMAVALAGANVLGIAVVVRLLRRFDFNPQFRRRRDVVVWCAASGAGTLVSPMIGPALLALTGYMPWSAWPQAWLMWWVSDLVGLLVAGPALMAVTPAHLTQWRHRLGEVSILAGATLLLGGVGFLGFWPAAFRLFNPMLLMLPMLVWGALRFGVVGASALALAVSFLAALATSLGVGGFAGPDPGAAVFSLWAFAGLAALLSLLITALEAERNQSESALQQQERALRSLADNLPDSILRIGRDLHVSFANRASEGATGHPAALLPGRAAANAIPPALTAGLTRVLATGRPENLEFSQYGPAGARQWAAQLVPEFGDGGEVQSVLILARDVTERQLLEGQLLQSQKLEAVGTLAGGIAHDFNNILTGIFGNAQMAQMDLSPDHAVQEWLQRIVQASQRAKSLVGQILTFSRRQRLQRQPLQLTAIVQEAMQLLRPTLPATIEIRTVLPPACPPVLADPGQLHQVLVNLLTNAAQAIGPGAGRIEIQVAAVEVDAEAVRQRPQLRTGRFVRLSVEDNGCGMDAATLARLFEPFFTTKPQGAGTGLGMAVVHGIVQRHDGAIVVYSEPGKGTNLMVYLPVHEAVLSASTDAGAAAPSRPGRGERVLVVDDEAYVLQAATGILARLGYATEGFTEPEAALAAFRADPGRFDLVLTDLTMPRLKGTEFAALVRAIRPGIPIILCTGFSGALATGETDQLRLHGPLSKPFSVDSLAQAVGTALRSANPGAA
jgi:PAS domain S-box-containing protein